MVVVLKLGSVGSGFPSVAAPLDLLHRETLRHGEHQPVEIRRKPEVHGGGISGLIGQCHLFEFVQFGIDSIAGFLVHLRFGLPARAGDFENRLHFRPHRHHYLRRGGFESQIPVRYPDDDCGVAGLAGNLCGFSAVVVEAAPALVYRQFPVGVGMKSQFLRLADGDLHRLHIGEDRVLHFVVVV